MAKLRNKDIQKVLQLFDNELLMMPRVSKIEKMKLRKRIVNVVQPALNSTTMKPEVFILEVEKKLAMVLRQFLDSYGFSRRLTDTVRKLYQNLEKSASPPPIPDDQ